MNNYGKGITITSGFDLGSALPLDSRTVVSTLDLRDELVTDNLAYPGMKVFVTATEKTYVFMNDNTWEEDGFNQDKFNAGVKPIIDKNTAQDTRLSNLESGVNTKLNKTDVVNVLTTTTAGKALDARAGKTLNDEINTKLSRAHVINNLNETNSGKALDAVQGYILQINKANKIDIVNNLTTSTTGKMLDAVQGKALNEAKFNKSDVVNVLNTTTAGKALDARQGKALNDRISVVEGLISGNEEVGGLSDLIDRVGVVEDDIDTKLDKNSVINILSAVSPGNALDARAGKTLNDLKLNKSDVRDSVEYPVNINDIDGMALSAMQGVILNNNVDLKVNKSDIVNTLTTTTTTSGKVLDARQGKVLNDAIATKISISNIVDNLTTTTGGRVLSANQGKVLNDLKVNKSDIVNTLTTTTTTSGKALDARQGKVLNDAIATKISISNIVDNVTTTTGGRVLSANQGKVLNDRVTSVSNAKIDKTSIRDSIDEALDPDELDGKVLSARQGILLKEELNDKINISSIVDNLTTVSSTSPLSASQGRELAFSLYSKANTSDIVNNLTTSTTGKMLDAVQGKALNEAKFNKSDVVNVLTTTTAGKALDARAGKTLNDRLNNTYTKAEVAQKISDIVSSAPSTLDTLKELADALGNDPNFATTVSNQIGSKLSITAFNQAVEDLEEDINNRISFSITGDSSIELS